MNKSKPNILLLFPDQWRGDCLGFSNVHPVQTPFLDDLAEKSVVFERAYAAHPTCIAARASLLTGLTANQHGRLGYQDGVPWRYKNTLPEILRNNGYETLCAGKTHFFPQRVRLGFEQIRLYGNQWIEEEFESDYHNWLKEKSNHTVRDPGLEICSDNSWYARSWPGPEEYHPNVWTTNEAMDLIDKRDPTRPFFLQVNYHRPHPPFDPPASFLEMYDDCQPTKPVYSKWSEEYSDPIKADLLEKWGQLGEDLLNKLRKAYYAQLTALDYEIGRLVYYLRRKQIFDNTIVIFSSDHGESLGDHNLFGKCTPFEPSVSIPFIFRFPEKYGIKPRTNRESLVSHIDIMPTVLESADLPIPDFCEGLSLISSCQEDADGQNRDFLHGEHAPAMRRTESWQFIIREHDKYIWDAVSGREWYFDLRNDPQEIEDKIQDNEYQQPIAECRSHLVEVLKPRKEDGLVEGNSLKPGIGLPSCRKELLNPILDYDGKTR
jgi:arylsulfatase A-like enzyme